MTPTRSSSSSTTTTRRLFTSLFDDTRTLAAFYVACLVCAIVVLPADDEYVRTPSSLLRGAPLAAHLRDAYQRDNAALVHGAGGEHARWDATAFHHSTNKWKRCVIAGYEGFPKPSWFRSQRPVLVFLWHTLRDFLYIHEESVRSCPVPCFFASEVVLEPDCLAEVDGFVFHPPTNLTRPIEPRTKHEYQQWVVFDSESEYNYPALLDPAYRARFDINMTYHLNDTVPFIYFISLAFYTGGEPTYWRRTEKNGTAPVMMMVGNCDARGPRNAYLAELMQHIRIDSFGSCFHNAELPGDLPAGVPWWEQKWYLMSRYKFVIGFENTVVPDYVTEKFFHPLIVSTVPVYLGAPNVDAFKPAEHSVINVADFASPRELALFLRWLDANDDEYERYLLWKSIGPRASFKQLEAKSPRSGPCRLCMEIARRQSALTGL